MTKHLELLEAAGFTAAATNAKVLVERAGRLAQAYEHYPYVSQEAIDKFNAKLKATSLTMTGKAGSNLRHHYDTLTFTEVKEYPSAPPAEVLGAVKEAQDRKIFDTLEVAHVVSVNEYKDPIVFGRIEGCGDRFFISQWGDDVSIEQLIGATNTVAELLAPHEG